MFCTGNPTFPHFHKGMCFRLTWDKRSLEPSPKPDCPEVQVQKGRSSYDFMQPPRVFAKHGDAILVQCSIRSELFSWQIPRKEAQSQQIAVQRPLSCVQRPSFPPGTEISKSILSFHLIDQRLLIPVFGLPNFRSENEGLISTDRGTKTTLVRTIPRSFWVVYEGSVFSNIYGCF